MDNTWWKKTSELDDLQKDIIELDLEGSYIVTGPPGSGKTNILLLRASYLNSAGLENCLLLSYTRSLKEFILSGGKIPEAWVSTYSAWGRRFLVQRGADRKQIKEDMEDMSEPEAREYLKPHIADAISTLADPKAYYDSILIDEVQDYSGAEIELLSKLTSRLFVVGDRKQKIYDLNGGIEAAVKAGCHDKKLQMHYRMGRKICAVADRLLAGESKLEDTCRYDEARLPSDVRVHQGGVGKQLGILVETLKTQLRAYPSQWFGILATKHETLDTVVAHLEKNGLADLYKIQRQGEDRSFDPEYPICVMTVQSAKGVEFRGVHLVCADVFPYFTREKAYTAITRAKTTLDIYHDGDMDAALKSALAARRVPKLDLDD